MRSVSSTLSALTRKAGNDEKHRFKSLYRLIDLQMLYESFRGLKRSAAPGVDDVTVTDYEKNLDENLRSLHRRLIEKRYRAQNVKRRYIPKPGSKKLRPLGIPTLEDKIVQRAASQILESIYEQDFYPSYVGLCGVASHSRIGSAIEASATEKESPGRVRRAISSLANSTPEPTAG